MKPTALAKFVETLKDISDGTRLRLLLELASGPKNVGTLTTALDSKQPTVSHHLSILHRAKILQSERVGKEVFYKMAPNSGFSITSSDKQLQIVIQGG